MALTDDSHNAEHTVDDGAAKRAPDRVVSDWQTAFSVPSGTYVIRSADGSIRSRATHRQATDEGSAEHARREDEAASEWKSLLDQLARLNDS